MRDTAWECWLHHCLCSIGKQVQPLQEFISPIEKVLCQARLTLKALGDLSRCTHTDGNRAEIQDAYRRHIPHVQEKRSEHQEVRDHPQIRQMKQPKEKRQPHRDSLKAEFHTRLLLDEQKDHILSDARSEMNMREPGQKEVQIWPSAN